MRAYVGGSGVASKIEWSAAVPLLGLLLWGGCAEVTKRGPERTVPSAKNGPDDADAIAFFYPEHRYPPFVVALADTFCESLPEGNDPWRRARVRSSFGSCFFSGFTMPNGTMTGGGVGGVEGFKAGQDYRRAHPDQVPAIMTAFGYQHVEIEGVWTVGFERSAFKPQGRKGEQWWLGDVGDTVSDIPEDFRMPDDGVAIFVDGYLSDKGQYGHLDAYPRELLAQRIHRVEPIDHKSRPTPGSQLR